MKIWTKETFNCNECRHLNRLDLDGTCNYLCNILEKDINEVLSIDKDCPFSKPITNEVIEGFGFTKLPEYTLCHNGAYVLETDKTFPLIRAEYKLDYIIECFKDNIFFVFKIKHIEGVDYENLVMEGIPIFMGTINNPEELKFILATIGVI